MNDYQTFLQSKRLSTAPAGFAVAPGDINPILFNYQRDVVRWALKRGRAAIFSRYGTGKTPMQLEWSAQVVRETGGKVLILAPLAVARQTQREGVKFGISVTVCRTQADVQPGINITNYEMLPHFDPSAFVGVVLDESSILKSYDGKTRTAIIEAFSRTPYRLACTATPAPNDHMELGNHAEFLGILNRTEMLAMFFTHDGGDTSVWRLKGHARTIFWRWVATWGAMIRKPSTLGFDDGAYNLPPLHLHEHHVSFEMPMNGMLFATEAQTLSERREARRKSLDDRVAACADMVNASATEPWVVWCDLNAEGDALQKAIPGSVQISGSDDVDTKESRLIDFAEGRTRVLISKPSICGWGLNWQHASHMAFVGVTDSYEAYYQAVRRCWRFGQSRDVHVHVFASKAEGAVVSNLKRKEREAGEMADALSEETRDAVMQEVTGMTRETNTHNAGRRVAVPAFLKESA